MTRRAFTFEDYLPLRALYARFDVVAEGRLPGNSSAAHRAVLDRLAANRRLAEALGWTGCALEREGGSGRLLSRGVQSAGGDREVIPDWVPGRMRSPAPAPTSSAPSRFEPLPSASAERPGRDEAKTSILSWLMRASPEWNAGMFERLAKRVAADALGADAATRSPRPVDSARSSARMLGIDAEWAVESRWLDDGGRQHREPSRATPTEVATPVPAVVAQRDRDGSRRVGR